MQAKKTQKNVQSKKGTQKKVVRNVKAPVAKGRIIKSTEPIFRTSSPGCIIVEKTEYIGEVVGSYSPFGVIGEYVINAGSPDTFPWLSRMAENFESYRFRSLRFHYETEAPTSSSGYVGLVVDYNPLDPPPTSKVVAMDFEESIRSPVWQSFSHSCDTKNLNKRKTYFCRDALDTDPDVGLFDVGNLFVVDGNVTIPGFGDGAAIGELWVSYICEFITPELGFGETPLDGAVGFSGTSPSTSISYTNNTTTTDIVLMDAPIQNYTRNSSSTIFVSSDEAPDLVFDINTVELGTNKDVFDLPVTTVPDNFVQSSNDVSYTGTAYKAGYGFALQQNASYIFQMAYDIMSGTPTSFAVDITVSNFSTSTITLLHSVGNSTQNISVWQVDVGNYVPGFVGSLLPLQSITLTHTTVATIVLAAVRWSIRYIRPYFTGIVPGYLLHVANKKRKPRKLPPFGLVASGNREDRPTTGSSVVTDRKQIESESLFCNPLHAVDSDPERARELYEMWKLAHKI